MLRASLDGGSLGRKGTCTWTTEPLRCSPETTAMLLSGYTPIQYKKFGKNKSSWSQLLPLLAYLCLSMTEERRNWREEENRLQTGDYDETGGVIQIHPAEAHAASPGSRRPGPARPFRWQAYSWSSDAHAPVAGLFWSQQEKFLPGPSFPV